MNNQIDLIPMAVISLSKNLVDLIGKDKVSASVLMRTSDPRGDWNCRLFYINKRKCVIFTNKATLYCVVRMGVLKKDLIDLSQFFMTSLFNQLRSDGFYNINEENFWLDNFSNLTFVAPDNDKKVNGSINNFISQLKTGLIYGSSLLKVVNDFTCAFYLNTIPMGSIGLKQPRIAFRELINPDIRKNLI